MEQFTVAAPRKINLEGFENKNTLSKTEFENLISKGLVEVFTPEGISKFIKDAQNTIEKSEDSQKDEIRKSLQEEVSSLHLHRVEGKVVYLRLKKKENDTIEKGEEINQLEVSDIVKSHISDCFQYGSLSKVEFSKKGSEIKEQIGKKITSLQGQKEDIKTKMSVLVETLPLKPSEPCSDYCYSGMKEKVGEVMRYPYNFTYINSNKVETSYDNLTPNPQPETPTGPTSQKEADMYSMYNMLAEQYIKRCVDIEYLQLFVNNLDDKKNYSLTVPQMMDLGIEK